MRANRRRDTLPELRLRSLLHAKGLRYRVDRPIRIDGFRPIRPDIVFGRARVAVFVDGCYWHGCPEHHQPSKSNVSYWHAKISRNQERDRENDAALGSAGWKVLRFWEHDDADEAATATERAVSAALTARSGVPIGPASEEGASGTRSSA
ncbi:MAG: very short patch repair endonuclease [Actinobacteria bacterium]|nr:very short patch repair endonuclease [Actinomycetota bacterium]